MKTNMLSIEKKKDRLRNNLLEALSDCVFWATIFTITTYSCVMVTMGSIKNGRYAFAFLGVIITFLQGTFFAWNYIRSKEKVENEVTRFWNVIQVMTEHEEFDLVGEQEKSKDIPRID